MAVSDVDLRNQAEDAFRASVRSYSTDNVEGLKLFFRNSIEQSPVSFKTIQLTRTTRITRVA